MITPLFNESWQTIKDIKTRTGHKTDVIARAARLALEEKLIEMRLTGDEYLMIPEFRKKVSSAGRSNAVPGGA